MAAPSYTEDLTDVDLAESTTGWSAYGGGASGLSASPDLSMQGTNCVDKQITNADKGQYFDNGSGITLGTGDHVWVWHYCATPGLTDTIQNKGASVLVGSVSTAYCQYHVEGNDTYGASGRVARCYPIDYTVRSTNASPPYRTVTGSPGANPRVFGGGLVTTASVKGANVGIDAIRYGTGAYLTAGELISAGDGSDNPCTFAGFSAQSDAVGNRWGILTTIAGSFELQGRFVIGQNNAGTATLCRFEDSDVNISLVNTIHAASDFTQFIIDHASTVCNWTNVSISALGTTNPGRVVVNNASTTFNVTGGTWTGLGITTLRAGCTIDGLTWRQCDAVTLNSATLEDCVIDRSTATSALVLDDLDLLTNCTFISDGTGHAINLGTISATDSMGWDCTDSGYAGTDGSTGNETILVNVASGQTLTVNVASGASTPTFYNTGSGAVNVVANAVTTQVTALDVTGSPIENVRVHIEVTGAASLPVADVVTITRSGSTATVSHTTHGLSTGDKVVIRNADQQEYNGVYTINVTGASSYTYTVSGTPTTPATGTIDSTFVVLNGLTNASGIVSASRTYSSNQPITGKARKSTSAPHYKSADIVGTLDSGTGLSSTVVMISDD